MEPFGFSSYCLMNFAVIGNFVCWAFTDNVDSCWSWVEVLLDIYYFWQSFGIFFIFIIIVDVVVLVTIFFVFIIVLFVSVSVSIGFSVMCRFWSNIHFIESSGWHFCIV